MINADNILNRITEVEYYAEPHELGGMRFEFPPTLVNDIKYVLNKQKEEIEQLKADKTKAFDYLFSKFAGHSNYHGDSILCAIEAVKEGKEIKTVKTMNEDGEQE